MELNVWFDEKIGEFSGAKDQYNADLIAKKAEGFAEGQASIVLPDPADPSAQYTQAQMDELAVIVRGENDAEVAGLQGQIDSLRQELDSVKAGQAQAISDLKVAMVDKVRAFKQSGDQSEEALIADLQA